MNGSCQPPTSAYAIGKIYYSDSTCSIDVIDSKTALGVVVYMKDANHGQVMSRRSMSGISQWAWHDSSWTDSYEVDIPNLPNYTTAKNALTDFDSCGNTDKIVAHGNSTTYPAAWKARNYGLGEKKWCLPAAGIMTSIYNNQYTIQAGIDKLEGEQYPNCCTWSSTEEDSSGVWMSTFNRDYGLSVGIKYYIGNLPYKAWAVMEF